MHLSRKKGPSLLFWSHVSWTRLLRHTFSAGLNRCSTRFAAVKRSSGTDRHAVSCMYVHSFVSHMFDHWQSHWASIRSSYGRNVSPDWSRPRHLFDAQCKCDLLKVNDTGGLARDTRGSWSSSLHIVPVHISIASTATRD
jgi:hypothetical protein